MKITFLFWNLNRKPIQSIISNLALRHEVDVIMLAECTIPIDKILLALNRSDESMFHHAPNINYKRIEIFTRFPSEFIRDVSKPEELKEREWFTIRHLKLPNTIDILLSVIHFPSKCFQKDSSQDAESRNLSELIKKVEKHTGNSRTVLVGDLNMSPFQNGVIGANGLNGTMSQLIAQKRERKVDVEEYPFFYNPMWNLLGDANSDPPGTYYYRNPEHNNLFWYMLDQVLIRPDLLDNFDVQELKILTSDGVASFLSKNGIPDDKVASDHLPLMFKLDL